MQNRKKQKNKRRHSTSIFKYTCINICQRRYGKEQANISTLQMKGNKYIYIKEKLIIKIELEVLISGMGIGMPK